MIIYKLRASFGKLKGTLELQAGYNELYLPNEAGKSTWSAFLVAMLYGVDTTERANAQNQGLPAKERYRPWDGSPMEGAVELEWQGRRITIERSTTGRVPMGKFAAYDSLSGTPIPELTGENCGKLLCGVERSVFERSAFIRQLGLTVTKDVALEKRLEALVATGEADGMSCSEVEKELKSRRNRLIGRAGRIPQRSAEATALEQRLKELHSLQEEAMRLHAQKENWEQQRSEAQGLLDRLERAREAQRRAGLDELEAQIDRQEQYCHQLEETLLHLPSEETLHRLRQELDRKESALQTAKMELAFHNGSVEKPQNAGCFAGLDGEAALVRAQQDEAEYRRLMATKPKKLRILLLLSVLLTAAGAGLSLFSLLPGLLFGVFGLLMLITVLALRFRSKAKLQKNALQAERLLLRYGLEDIGGLLPLAEEYAAEMASYQKKYEENQLEQRDLQAACAAAQQELDEVLLRVQRFAPDCRNAKACRDAISDALTVHAELLSCRRQSQAQRRQYQTLLPVLGNAAHRDTDPEALEFDEAKLLYEKRSATEHLEQLNSRLDQIRGALSAMGDPVAMESALEQLREQIDRDTVQLEIIDIAMAALQEADEALRTRFSPRITAEAGQILSELTGEKYATVLLDPELQLSVREDGGRVMRPAAAMSCGTADQMYLALRLAMSRQLLPGAVPLILDDTLVNFDDTRVKAAVKLLKKEAENRQVILFTCRKL